MGGGFVKEGQPIINQKRIETRLNVIKGHCIVCGLPLDKLDPKGSFVLCNGSKELPHPDYLLSLKFVSNGELPLHGKTQINNSIVEEGDINNPSE